MSLRYETAKFEASYGKIAQLPAPDRPEVAFVGRSNVGKSSLINALLHRKNLAKTSSTPGKTANINFFDVDGVAFVDLPGYGFAKVSKAERQRWADLIDGYFMAERSHNLVVALVDIRHEAQKLDLQMISYLSGNQLPFIVALTKADKLSKTKAASQHKLLADQFGLDTMALVPTSAKTGQGMHQVKRFIEDACL